MNFKKLRPHLGKLLLAGIFIVLSLSSIVWTLRDRTLPPWDPADHVSSAYDYYALLARLDLRGFVQEFFTTPHYYAPMVHLISAIVFLVLGASRLTGIAVNLISLAALMCAMSWMARTLYGRSARSAAPGPDASWPGVALTVLPALVCACYHFNAWLMHDAFLDFPLVAMVAVSFACLIRAGDFKDRRAALLFGVSAGIGLLLKQTFAFFFLLPALYIGLRVLLSRDRRAILNLMLAGGAGLAIAALWYAPHFQDVIAVYHQNQQAAIDEKEEPLYSFASNFYYVHALISMQMQLPLGVLFAGGVLYSLVRRRRESTLLYLWIISGIGVFAMIANKDVRYTVPVLPAVALLSLCWLGDLKKSASVSDTSSTGRAGATISRALKLALVAAIAAWSLAGFFNAQWPEAGYGYAIDTPHWRWMVWARNYYTWDRRPGSDDWSVPEIVRSVVDKGLEDRAAGLKPARSGAETNSVRQPSPHESISPRTGATDERPTLGVIVNLPYLNPSSIALEARFQSRERAGAPVIRIEWIVVESALDRIEVCDYLLVRTGLEDGEGVSATERKVESLIREQPARFTRVASLPIPLKESEAIIYRCEK